MSYGIKLKTFGTYACFTRPEMKAERVSYDVITPSAARGILEAIYWKPEIRWIICAIHVLAPIQWTNIRRNEVGCKIGSGTVNSAMRAGEGNLGIFIEEERQQRASLVLRDVCYAIEANFEILDGESNPAKHLDIFNRRARAGQRFQQPYFGCREFPADFELIEGDVPRSPLAGTPEGNKDLGYMLHDMVYKEDPKGKILESSRNGRNPKKLTAEPHFFRAQMNNGIITVPSLSSTMA